jgi:hypothetical protein
MTDSNELLTVSSQGQLIDRRQLQGLAGLDTAPDGKLLAYTDTGLWTISEDGTWAQMGEAMPGGSDSNAVLSATDRPLYLLSSDAAGNVSTLYSYDASGQRWAVSLPYMPGMTELTEYDSALLLTGNHGYILAIQPSTGAICGQMRIYGSRRARVWHDFGVDGILRVAVADQVLGLDWQSFLGGCA